MSHTPIPFWRLARSAAKSIVAEEHTMSYIAAPLWGGPCSGRFRRRQFMRTAAGTVGVVFAAGLLGSAPAGASGDPVVLPNPIPGGFTGEQLGCPGVTELFHLFIPSFPAEDEPSTITDFNGFHGDAHIQGFGTATNTMTGAHTRLFYDADIRFMKGEYIGVDGETHRGAFGFV
jgi:hypothetical protein